MTNIKREYNCVVVGGGAAGIMAALSLKKHHPELNVLLVEKSFALGRKILVSGAGRCNITNVNLGNSDYLKHFYTENEEILTNVFGQYGYNDIIDFFTDLGIPTYVERKTMVGKVFPETNQAKSVVNLLEDELMRKGVEIALETELLDFTINPDQSFKLQMNNQGQISEINCQKLILSSGGKTYPALGSDGKLLTVLARHGFEIVPTVVAAVPMEAKNLLSQEVQGSKMDLEVKAIINGKLVKTSQDEVMFTQYGFSGPAILNVSREISIAINRNNNFNVKLSLNFFPGLTKDRVETDLRGRWQKRSDQKVALSLTAILPSKIAWALPKISGINPEIPVADLLNQQSGQFTKLLTNLTDFQVPVTATRGWNEGEFTAGGVRINQINLETLQAKNNPNLYFCGEILDVDGDVGGYNLSWAWSSGWLAGKILPGN